MVAVERPDGPPTEDVPAVALARTLSTQPMRSASGALADDGGRQTMPCLDCGRPGPRLCTTCQRIRDRGRGTTTARGYGADHQAARAEWQALIDSGEPVDCVRCGEPIKPGEAWDLGHDDEDRTIRRGPEHPRQCNRAAGGRRAHTAD